jgi:hypothetical protein
MPVIGAIRNCAGKVWAKGNKLQSYLKTHNPFRVDLSVEVLVIPVLQTRAGKQVCQLVFNTGLLKAHNAFSVDLFVQNSIFTKGGEKKWVSKTDFKLILQKED